MEVPAVGGKDSMSGTFMDLHVPPTLVSFAVNVIDGNYAVSSEAKAAGDKLVFLSTLCWKAMYWILPRCAKICEKYMS